MTRLVYPFFSRRVILHHVNISLGKDLVGKVRAFVLPVSFEWDEMKRFDFCQDFELGRRVFF